VTAAFWNRWVILEFPFTFLSGKEFEALADQTDVKLADPEIISKLTTEEELSGLLNLALDGLERLRAQKDFSYAKSVEDVKVLWQRRSSSFNAFMMDRLEEEWDGTITKPDLRHAYADYCKLHKVKMIGDKTIKDVLTIEMGVSESQEGKDRERVWKGVKFKPKEAQGDNGQNTGYTGNTWFSTLMEIFDFSNKGENAVLPVYPVQSENKVTHAEQLFSEFIEKMEIPETPKNPVTPVAEEPSILDSIDEEMTADLDLTQTVTTHISIKKDKPESISKKIHDFLVAQPNQAADIQDLIRSGIPEDSIEKGCSDGDLFKVKPEKVQLL
jgi:hypothetical protein